MIEIKAHVGEGTWPDPSQPLHWREPTADRPFRTCSYCGSIHAEDLLAAFEAGATAHGADWKYGWPHKFYIKTKGHPKWYNLHFADLPDELFTKLSAILLLHTDIEFARDEQGIGYRAPCDGYQK